MRVLYTYILVFMSHRSEQIAGIVRSTIARMALGIPPTVAQGVTITDVQLSKDLSYADVFVGALSGAERAIHFLQSHASVMRKILANDLGLHRVPRFRYAIDATAERGAKIDQLLRAVVRESVKVQKKKSSTKKVVRSSKKSSKK